MNKEKKSTAVHNYEAMKINKKIKKLFIGFFSTIILVLCGFFLLMNFHKFFGWELDIYPDVIVLLLIISITVFNIISLVRDTTLFKRISIILTSVFVLCTLVVTAYYYYDINKTYTLTIKNNTPQTVTVLINATRTGPGPHMHIENLSPQSEIQCPDIPKFRDGASVIIKDDNGYDVFSRFFSNDDIFELRWEIDISSSFY